MGMWEIGEMKKESYYKLRKYLASNRTDANGNIILSFCRIEEIMGESLPIKAKTSTSWWWNISIRRRAHEWLKADFKVSEVDFTSESVYFNKIIKEEQSIKEKILIRFVELIVGTLIFATISGIIIGIAVEKNKTNHESLLRFQKAQDYYKRGEYDEFITLATNLQYELANKPKKLIDLYDKMGWSYLIKKDYYNCELLTDKYMKYIEDKHRKKNRSNVYMLNVEINIGRYQEEKNNKYLQDAIESAEKGLTSPTYDDEKFYFHTLLAWLYCKSNSENAAYTAISHLNDALRLYHSNRNTLKREEKLYSKKAYKRLFSSGPGIYANLITKEIRNYNEVVAKYPIEAFIKEWEIYAEQLLSAGDVIGAIGIYYGISEIYLYSTAHYVDEGNMEYVDKYSLLSKQYNRKASELSQGLIIKDDVFNTTYEEKIIICKVYEIELLKMSPLKQPHQRAMIGQSLSGHYSLLGEECEDNEEALKYFYRAKFLKEEYLYKYFNLYGENADFSGFIMTDKKLDENIITRGGEVDLYEEHGKYPPVYLDEDVYEITYFLE